MTMMRLQLEMMDISGGEKMVMKLIRIEYKMRVKMRICTTPSRRMTLKKALYKKMMSTLMVILLKTKPFVKNFSAMRALSVWDMIKLS